MSQQSSEFRVQSSVEAFCEQSEAAQSVMRRWFAGLPRSLRSLAKSALVLLSVFTMTACGVQGELKRPSEMSEKEKQEAWW